MQIGVLYDSDIQWQESCCFIPSPLEQGPSINIQPLQQTVNQNLIATMSITLMLCGAAVQRSD